MQKIVHEKNYELWSGVSGTYHDNRPVPPQVIIKIILSWLKKEPEIVVDVGCGTGLSAIIWKDIAAKIIGIEPNDDMRTIAEKNVSCDSIAFSKGVSNETNLP
ncbi:MAG: class I SAM-dependent methyltransferase, partial [Clostridiales bacterium]|nr:class I SAM-dependent methyltransferase [Clostridiales bacterium]